MQKLNSFGGATRFLESFTNGLFRKKNARLYKKLLFFRQNHKHRKRRFEGSTMEFSLLKRTINLTLCQQQAWNGRTNSWNLIITFGRLALITLINTSTVEALTVQIILQRCDFK